MSEHGLRPIGDNILVKPIEADKEINGIVLPDSARQDFPRGEVVAVGQGVIDANGNRVPMDVYHGAVIVHGYNGPKVRIGGEEFLLFRQAHVIAIVE